MRSYKAEHRTETVIFHPIQETRGSLRTFTTFNKWNTTGGKKRRLPERYVHRPGPPLRGWRRSRSGREQSCFCTTDTPPPLPHSWRQRRSRRSPISSWDQLRVYLDLRPPVTLPLSADGRRTLLRAGGTEPPLFTKHALKPDPAQCRRSSTGFLLWSCE